MLVSISSFTAGYRKLFFEPSFAATGLAVGTASHGLGTARALKDGELEGAMSGIAMMNQICRRQ